MALAFAISCNGQSARAETCPPYPVGVNVYQASSDEKIWISVARAELISSEKDIPLAEARILARRNLMRQKGIPKVATGVLRGALNISECQADNFLYAVVHLSSKTLQQSQKLYDQTIDSLSRVPTPQLGDEPRPK